jgi:polyketide biosynthesis enoyl-CoA hydratase PksH
MDYQTIQLEFQDSVCFLRLHRPDAGNTINERLVAECSHALERCEGTATVVVLSGSADVFCLGADFRGLNEGFAAGRTQGDAPGPLYDLWLRLNDGPYVTVSHVQGKANAGGIGFVAASDIVLADEKAQFSLSELLFGLYPACVLPFLMRRVGFQRANYLTLMTRPITATQACEYGLVDAVDAGSEVLLQRHLNRLRCLTKPAIRAYKEFVRSVSAPLQSFKTAAVNANLKMFSDPVNQRAIADYVKHGVFPWERQA